jgi:ABC-2 type transport system ATP-binding protein
MFAIESKNLTKHYSGGKIKALTDFSVGVEEGKIFSLLGPNGAGKTTLVKLMLSIAKPTGGEGFIFGLPVNDPASRKNIGYLSEDHRLPGYLDSEQFLFYYGKMSGVSHKDLKLRIPELLKQVKLADRKGLKLKKYSKGMLQRLGTAQALLNDPKLLFLDEPTDGIDPIGRIEIREILLDLKKKGKTIFINSHLLSEVERISDRIAILKDGRLVKTGPTSEFIETTGRYSISVDKNSQETASNIFRSSGIDFDCSGSEFTLKISDTGLLNSLIDGLRSNNIKIEGIVPEKNSLEDYFIKILR